jgi:hypothetical protein
VRAIVYGLLDFELICSRKPAKTWIDTGTVFLVRLRALVGTGTGCARLVQPVQGRLVDPHPPQARTLELQL